MVKERAVLPEEYSIKFLIFERFLRGILLSITYDGKDFMLPSGAEWTSFTKILTLSFLNGLREDGNSTTEVSPKLLGNRKDLTAFSPS